MDSGRPRGLAALLTLALSAGTVAGAGLLGSPAWAADPLTGTFNLDSTSIWTGQQVTLAQVGEVANDPTPETPAQVSINWGDGNTDTTTAADANKVKHHYSAVGSYPVAVTLRDTPGDEAQPVAVSTVTVAAVPGLYKFDPTWNWTWAGGGHSAKFVLSGVPANATRVWVNWGDDEVSLLSRSTLSTTHNYGPGTFTAYVTLENAQGKSEAKRTSTYQTRVDTIVPTATLKVPSSPTKAASWKTVQGTAKDGQIGMDAVGVQLFKWSTTTDYYYNFTTKKWVKYNPGSTTIPNAALAWRTVDSAGVWKVAVAGLSKGYTLEVDYFALDRAGNASPWKWRAQKLTS
ncbi:hypothetical protein [Actinoplanes sp. NPDC026623]|uniref:hypothetical protein n=1 Tax=Actinoplanes sp. NPDC026623 TaxID=3155610 RepID=UPI0033D67067